jgi:hypothetical protein
MERLAWPSGGVPTIENPVFSFARSDPVNDISRPRRKYADASVRGLHQNVHADIPSAR